MRSNLKQTHLVAIGGLTAFLLASPSLILAETSPRLE
jgi:hypothetical protein